MYVIFDLDGTLSDDSHRRHLVEGKTKLYHQYHMSSADDPARIGLVALLRTLVRSNHRVEIWTARPDTYRQITKTWLQKNIGPLAMMDVVLRMRQDNDMERSSNEIKGEWLDYVSKVEGVWPDLVFDDRDKTTDFWREKGIVCAQVARNT